VKVREVVPPALAGERVDRVVSMLTGRSRSEVADLVSAGEVLLDGRPVPNRSLRVSEGQVLEVALAAPTTVPELLADPAVELVVVHEDEALLVVDKPAGLVVHPGAGQPTGTLVHGLLARYPDLAAVGEPHRPGIVHRLDKGTSGLMVVARTSAAYERLVDDLAGRRVERRYDTLVWGEVRAPSGLIDAPIGRSARDPARMTVTEQGKSARTRYELRSVHDRPVVVSRLSCSLETGRTHQIRVHLRSIGHPVVGDATYGGARQSLPLARPFLHAAELALTHPLTGAELRWTSDLPADLVAVLDQLE
jgi:23S rRNA pseudouridine1911/1915/1917 synthase